MIMPHSKVVGFKDRRATESVVTLLKAATKQNNVKLGKRKAGLLPAAFSQREDHYRESVSPGQLEMLGCCVISH